MYKYLISITFVFLLFGCNQNTKQNSDPENSSNTNLYAQNFTITQHEDYSLLEIINPWLDAQNISYTYAIAHSPNAQLPKNTIHIQQSPTRVAAISTTHIAFIEKINRLKSLIAVSDMHYVYSPKLKQQHKQNPIAEVGFDTNLNIEKLLQLKIEVVFLYGISNEIEPLRKKLLQVGIVPVMIGEYMEQHPLGKAEWIKVFGAVYNTPEVAEKTFKDIANDYLKLKKLTANVQSKPTVFTGLPWNETWHTPGGNSFTATFINDAGAKYIFANDTGSVNYQYDIEIVYQRGGNADFWINTGIANSLDEIKAVDKRMPLFKAFSQERIYNNNNIAVLGGGSDYLESGAVNPHIILRDLIKIFHPQLLADSLYYYKRLN